MSKKKENKKPGKFKMLPIDDGNIDKIKEFSNHPFKPYENEQLAKMVESVKEHGVIQPISVRTINDDDTYEIISGHQRLRAAIGAGLDEIPVIIHEDVSDEEAAMFVNETNITQRDYKNFSQSEKAKSIKMYHEAIKQQGKRTDLPSETSGQVDPKDDYARTKTAKIYKISESTVKRYLELDKLIEPLMDKLDNKIFGTSPAGKISKLNPNEQELINSTLEDKDNYKLNTKNATELLKLSQDTENFTKEKIKNILNKDNNISKIAPVKVETDIYEHLLQLFPDETNLNKVYENIKIAVDSYNKANSENGNNNEDTNN